MFWLFLQDEGGRYFSGNGLERSVALVRSSTRIRIETLPDFGFNNDIMLNADESWKQINLMSNYPQCLNLKIRLTDKKPR